MTRSLTRLHGVVIFMWLFSAIISLEGKEKKPSPKIRHEHIDSQIWQEVSPYLMPYNHPVKVKLDKFFAKTRATQTIKTLKEAGFINPVIRKWTRLIVTSHPKFPGYIFKIYSDKQHYHAKKPEYFYWIRRIKGAAHIQNMINENGWNHLFKVPKKWIYMLPAKPSPSAQFLRKDFILIEEDMQILNDEANKNAWGSPATTPFLLGAVYRILNELGMRDCAKPDNIPFCKDGKVAFIDTQSHHHWPVSFQRLDYYLTPDMRELWQHLRAPQ